MTKMGGRATAWLVTAALLAAPLPATAAPNVVAGLALAGSASDPCDRHRTPFRAIRDYRMGQVIGGVVAGMALEGLRAILNGDKVRPGNVVIAGIGGGVVAHFLSAKKAAANREALQAALNADYRDDMAQFSPLAAALADLGNCRRQQIYAVQTQYEARTIDQRKAAKALDAIERDIAADNRIISGAAKRQVKVITAYAQETAMADGQDPTAVGERGEAILEEPGMRDAAFEAPIDEQWVDARGVDITPPMIPFARRYVVAAKGTPLRAQGMAAAAVVRTLPRGAALDVVAGDGAWLEVPGEGASSYVAAADVAISPPPRVKPPAPAANALANRPGRRKALPPGAGVRRLAVRPPVRRPVTTRDQPKAAVAARTSFVRVAAADSAATAEQLRAARLRLES
ncbi:hypothetical protein [Sphingomonas sp. VNH70]|uniref:hypothetical protein n=1 Tax=Sphingomonas silueang TaxID=3156617 RepID=UPI0032B515B8